MDRPNASRSGLSGYEVTSATLYRVDRPARALGPCAWHTRAGINTLVRIMRCGDITVRPKKINGHWVAFILNATVTGTTPVNEAMSVIWQEATDTTERLRGDVIVLRYERNRL